MQIFVGKKLRTEAKIEARGEERGRIEGLEHNYWRLEENGQE